MDSELKNSILKTGTTILGIVCKDGVVMASDRQVTAGNLVVGKNYPKTVQINDYLLISFRISSVSCNTSFPKSVIL